MANAGGRGGGETTSVATSVWFVVACSQLDMVLQITKPGIRLGGKKKGGGNAQKSAASNVLCGESDLLTLWVF